MDDGVEGIELDEEVGRWVLNGEVRFRGALGVCAGARVKDGMEVDDARCTGDGWRVDGEGEDESS